MDLVSATRNAIAAFRLLSLLVLCAAWPLHAQRISAYVDSNGKVVFKSYCYDDGKVWTSRGTWKADDRGVHFTIKKQTETFTFVECGTSGGTDNEQDGRMCLSKDGSELGRGPH